MADEKWITTAQAAEILGLTRVNGSSRVSQLARQGKLKGWKMPNGLWSVEESSVREYAVTRRPNFHPSGTGGRHVAQPPPATYMRELAVHREAIPEKKPALPETIVWEYVPSCPCFDCEDHRKGEGLSCLYGLFRPPDAPQHNWDGQMRLRGVS